MKPFVLALSGRIASGKSTLALRLAERLNCARASFGDYVRTVAGSRSLELTRTNLQAVGAALIEAGWEPFCRAVLSQSAWQPGQLLVIEGVRHVEAVRRLKVLVVPSRLILVHIRIDEKLRTDRVRKSKGAAESLDETHEAHATEHDVKTVLPLVADLVVDGARLVDDLADEIICFAGRHVA